MKHKMQTINEHIGKMDFHKVVKQSIAEKRGFLVEVMWKFLYAFAKNDIYVAQYRNINLINVTDQNVKPKTIKF